ncbi:MAG: rhodanese-like domain-containing protein [Gammaproteobacteria bacterium]
MKKPARLMPALFLLLSTIAWSATDIGVTELQQRQAKGDVVVIDVRSPAEYAQGHVPGAINIPHDQAGERAMEIRALQKKGEVVLYCRSGRRVAAAAEALEARGVTGLRHLKGDIQGWQAAGAPMSPCTTY